MYAYSEVSRVCGCMHACMHACSEKPLLPRNPCLRIVMCLRIVVYIKPSYPTKSTLVANMRILVCALRGNVLTDQSIFEFHACEIRVGAARGHMYLWVPCCHSTHNQAFLTTERELIIKIFFVLHRGIYCVGLMHLAKLTYVTIEENAFNHRLSTTHSTYMCT